MDCIFCKIAQKQIPSEIVYEDDNVFAFLDAKPISKGHTLVIPKNHVSTILNISDEGIAPFFKKVKEITRLLKETLSPDGFTIGINHGESAGQVIGHLHLHIIPRWKDDGGGSIHNVVKNTPKETNEEILKKIQIK